MLLIKRACIGKKKNRQLATHQQNNLSTGHFTTETFRQQDSTPTVQVVSGAIRQRDMSATL